jgi:HD-GYP domain-containing protein (c-di-GMP phosphodiesterase class II)
VIAVADSFDAMTSDRPYRSGMAWERAAALLREGRGSQWDAELVDAFLRALAEGLGQRPIKQPAARQAPPVPGQVSAG